MPSLLMSNESEVTLNLGTDDHSQFGEKLDELRTYAIAALIPFALGGTGFKVEWRGRSLHLGQRSHQLSLNWGVIKDEISPQELL